jgi:hypothetical protein
MNIIIMKEKKFDLKDISIIPAILSSIDSRKECNTKHADGFLPLMASPMDTVVCGKNIDTFINNKIIPCAPRGKIIIPDITQLIKYNKVCQFNSFGLSEIEKQLDNFKININDKYAFYHFRNVLIDIANAHMLRLLNVVKEIKKLFPDIVLMVGNVAHPLTYKNLAMAGADYVRISIGTGAGCTTAANVAINYPIGSLIKECYEEKIKGGFTTKIVADGGMKGYDDIFKALALGADYVMIGSLFNKAMQSAGFNYLYGIRLPYHIAKVLWKWGFPIKKKYRGMSTKAVQRKWGKTQLVTAEGITKYQKVEYNLSQWVENFEDYLRSNMSYCGCRTLDEFIGKVDWEYITYNALKRFEK